VAPRPGDEFGAVFTVSGQVSTVDGKPVEGAIVVLRESSTDRISMEPDKFLYDKQRHCSPFKCFLRAAPQW
jgi:hypothetical protein